MPRRRIDPTTGEPQLTYREQRLIDEYFKNGGNGSRAAIAAGYGSARPDQSAYKVLHRAEVQRHIRDRIAESPVSAGEIIGTLVSFMRGKIGDFFDQSRAFSIELAKLKGIDHQLKSVSGTTRRIEATGDKPVQIVHNYRGQLHSPVQAAKALARILGINPKTLSPLTDHWPLTADHCPQSPQLILDLLLALAQRSPAALDPNDEAHKEAHNDPDSNQPDATRSPVPTQDSRLQTRDSVESHPLSMFSSSPPPERPP